MTTIQTRFKIAGYTAAEWAAANPVLLDREPAFETDTLYMKIGDGVSAWNDLEYLPGPQPDAEDVNFTPAGGLSATDVQAALAELGSGKQPLDADLTALAALSGTNTIYYRSAANTWSAITVGGLLSFSGGTINVATATSGAAIPLLSGANTWGGQQVFPAIRIDSTAPVLTLKDTDTSGTNATGYVQAYDSANAQIFTFGKPFSGGAVYYNNVNAHDHHFAQAGNSKVHIDTANSRLNMVAGFVVRINSVQVLGPRVTGWAAATGTATRTTFATGSVTLPQLAERVKALIDDLTAHGLIGT